MQTNHKGQATGHGQVINKQEWTKQDYGQKPEIRSIPGKCDSKLQKA